RCGRAHHDGIAAGLLDYRGSVFRRAGVAVADDGNRDRVLHRRDVLPARLAGVAVLTRAGMQSDGVQAAVLGYLRQVYADDVGVVPAEAEFDREGNRDRRSHRLEDALYVR